MLLILHEHLLEGHELVVGRESRQLDVQVLTVEERVLLVEVGYGHIDLVHPEVLEEDREGDHQALLVNVFRFASAISSDGHLV